MIKSEDVPTGGSWGADSLPAEGELLANPLFPLCCNSVSLKVDFHAGLTAIETMAYERQHRTLASAPWGLESWILGVLSPVPGTSPMAQVVKNPPASAGDARDVGSIPGWGRCPGEGNSNPLQYSCLENPTDRGSWRPTVHGVARVRHDWVHMHISNLSMVLPHGKLCDMLIELGKLQSFPPCLIQPRVSILS